MGNKEYIESGGIDESADEGDDKYEENALYADRIVPMLTDFLRGLGKKEGEE